MSGSELPYTEEQMIEGLKAGNEQAFSRVYRLFHQRVLFFARRYVNETEAQDVTAETFIQLWKNRARFDDAKSISAFLFVTSRNRCYNHLRDTKYRQSQEQVLIEHLERATAASFQAEEIRLQLVELLNAQIEKLPARMRDVFLLSFRDGLKPAQIAEQLGIQVKTVSNQKLSAIHILRQALADHPLEAVLLVLLQLP